MRGNYINRFHGSRFTYDGKVVNGPEILMYHIILKKMGKIKELKTNQLFQDNYFQCLIDKWGITAEELNEAILETGSLEEICIKKYLLQKGILISIFGIFYYSINTVKGYFKLKFNKKKNVNRGFSLSRASYMTICSN